MERQHAKMAAIDVYDENEASDNDDDDDDVGHYSDCDHVVKLDESSVDDTMTSYADQNDDRPRGDPPGGVPDFDLNHEPMWTSCNNVLRSIYKYVYLYYII